MSDTNPTQIPATGEATGFIPAPCDVVTVSTVDNWNADVARDAMEADKHGDGEKLLAQIWSAWWLRVLVGFFLVCPVKGAEEPLVLPVWPGAVPGDYGTIGPERLRAPSEAPTKNAKWITGVTKPTVSLFRSPKDKNTGAAILICPGGGYWNLAWDLEGEEVAAWLNTVGVTGLVLKYRVPRRPGQPEPLPPAGPLLDAQRAVSLVRSRAAEWGIDPKRIGILGFSAGGHLAVATATHFDQRTYEPIDEIDKISCRPDFAVAVYPGYLIEQQTAGVETNKNVLAPYIRIPRETPPVFLVHSSDDTMAGAENSVVMYLALKRANVATELHVYAHGGHGFGVRKSSLPCSTWTDRCLAWLQNQGMLGTKAEVE
jgi:acetyl esterase/lipase